LEEKNEKKAIHPNTHACHLGLLAVRPRHITSCCSFIRGPNKVPSVFSGYWEQKGPSFLILKNTRGQKK